MPLPLQRGRGKAKAAKPRRDREHGRRRRGAGSPNRVSSTASTQPPLPRRVPAICTVCAPAGETSKYKCPKCLTPYCSLACYKVDPSFTNCETNVSLTAPEPYIPQVHNETPCQPPPACRPVIPEEGDSASDSDGKRDADRVPHKVCTHRGSLCLHQSTGKRGPRVPGSHSSMHSMT